MTEPARESHSDMAANRTPLARWVGRIIVAGVLCAAVIVTYRAVAPTAEE